jgi:peroxiredoxin
MMSLTKRNLFALVGCVALVGLAAPTDAFAQQGRQKDKPQQKDHNHDHKHGDHACIGEPAPAFTLTDTDGKTHALADLKGKIVVLEWFNPGCPVVVMHHEKHSTMKDLQKKYADKDVVWLAVNSGAPGQQGHGQKANAGARKDWNIGYPVLLDESGKVGRAYEAKTTPHMYIIDKEGILRYNGAIDNGSGRARGDVNYVDQALTQIIAGETVSTAETKPYGCAVKYAKGRN